MGGFAENPFLTSVDSFVADTAEGIDLIIHVEFHRCGDCAAVLSASLTVGRSVTGTTAASVHATHQFHQLAGIGAGQNLFFRDFRGSVPFFNLLQNCGGSILIDGQDVTKLPEHKRAALLGRVFQDPMMGTAPTMMIEENLALAARRGQRRGLQWVITPLERADYKELLRTLDLGLEDRLTSKVGLLSGGQRQALTLLMASLKQPKLLLLDEHTAALDPKTAAKVLTLSDQIVQENRLTTLMITHNMKDAIAHGNRLIMMDAGRVVVDISGEEKKKLTVPDLLALFSSASGSTEANDKLLLS